VPPYRLGGAPRRSPVGDSQLLIIRSAQVRTWSCSPRWLCIGISPVCGAGEIRSRGVLQAVVFGYKFWWFHEPRKTPTPAMEGPAPYFRRRLLDGETSVVVARVLALKNYAAAVHLCSKMALAQQNGVVRIRLARHAAPISRHLSPPAGRKVAIANWPASGFVDIPAHPSLSDSVKLHSCHSFVSLFNWALV
jgi:hypothetical protein